MQKFKITVNKNQGLNSRPSKEIAEKASEFKSNVSILYNGRKVNGKTAYGIESLQLHGIHNIVEVTVIIHGSDEAIAAEELKKFFEVQKY